jgi:hypothetical protein
MGIKTYERLYALAAQSEPDAAEELTACADAARGMLAALKHMVHWHDQLSPADIAKASAAIAKAEGRS